MKTRRVVQVRGLKCAIAVSAVVLTTLGGVAPQQAWAGPTTWRAPFDGTVVDTLASPRAEVPLCTADAASGAVAGKVLAHARDMSDTSPSGQCTTGMTVSNIRVPGSRFARPVDLTATFDIDSAVAEVPPGQTESGGMAFVMPCVRVIATDGSESTDWDTCNYWWDMTDNGVFTPLFGVPDICRAVCVPDSRGARDVAENETWTWTRHAFLSQGTYEVRAYLLVYASNNDPLVGPVTAEVDGTVTSVEVHIGA